MHAFIKLRRGLWAATLVVGCFAEPPAVEEGSSTSGSGGETSGSSSSSGSSGSTTTAQTNSTSGTGSSSSTGDASAEVGSTFASTAPGESSTVTGFDGQFANLFAECSSLLWSSVSGPLECGNSPGDMPPAVFLDPNYPMGMGGEQAIIVMLAPGGEASADFTLQELGIPADGEARLELGVACAMAPCTGILEVEGAEAGAVDITPTEFSDLLELGTISADTNLRLTVRNTSNGVAGFALINPFLYVDEF